MNDREKPDRRDEAFAARASKLLRAQADSLDAATMSRLNRARYKALDEGRNRAVGTGWSLNWLPAGGVALVAALIAVLWIGNLQPGAGTGERGTISTVLEGSAVDDLEVLLAEESLEMLEDLDFYTWMDAAMIESLADDEWMGS